MKKDEIRNMLCSFLSSTVAILVGLAAQKLFINFLGKEYLGFNGLFSNVISMLSIVEFGIGSAIVFNLYKPIVEKDKETIKSLMNFYKKAYYLIALIILVLGICVIPFLNYFVNGVTVNANIKIIYLLFLLNTVASYLFSYKRSLLYAYKKNYIINLIHILYILVLNFVQLIVLYFSHNYYLYLIIKIIMVILENIVISVIVNKKYGVLISKDSKLLDKNIKKDIFQKCKALLFHKVGGFIVFGTDNIIISTFLGVVTVGMYSNYYLVINAVVSLCAQVITALVPSVGLFLVYDNKSKNYELYKKIKFMTFWIDTFVSTSILVIMQSFIVIWVGEEFLFSNIILFILVFNCFQNILKNYISVFKEAAGIYYEDRFIPLLESFVNIVTSVVLCKYIGLAGVFIGTIMSSMVLWLFSYFKFTYKKLFNKDYFNYLKEVLFDFILFLIIAGLSYYLSIVTSIVDPWLNFFKNIFIAAIVPNIILILIFRKTDNFKYFLNIIKKALNKLMPKD